MKKRKFLIYLLIILVLVGISHASSTKSKLSIHTSFFGPESEQFIRNAQPTVVKILDEVKMADDVKQWSPNTKVIGRLYSDNEPYDGDPEQRALEWWSRWQGIILNPENAGVDYWEGYNEPVIFNPTAMDWYARFEKKRVQLLTQHGKKACIGNFPTGTPPYEWAAIWQAFYPAIDEAIAQSGVLGLHEYSAPSMMDLFDFSSGEGDLTGRYRRVYNRYLVPTGREIPLVITECGIDGGVLGDPQYVQKGWKTFTTANDYVNQLKWYDSLLKEDDYVLGATIFSIEIYNWDDFDIRGDVRVQLQDYVGNGGSPPPDPTRWQAEYFNNMDLSGSPAVRQYEDSIHYQWGSSAPAGGVNADHFSVKWTKEQHFDEGDYRFFITTDDGMRLWVDGSLILNEWRDQPPTTFESSAIHLSGGDHNIKVEYYENMGGATAILTWEPVTIPVCGNGIPEPGEECDDGNTVDDCTCLADCRLPHCGDGLTCGSEQCDRSGCPEGQWCAANCVCQGGGPGPWRPPTVVLTPDNIAHLQTFPRPPNDNGRGIHFGLDLRQDHIDRFKPMIADLDIKWVLVYAGDEQQIERAATAMWEANEAFVVARPAAKIDRGWPNWEGFVQKMQQVGVPPYIQIFNEPGDDREWDGRVPSNYEEIYAQKWIQAARRIVNAGGYPGVQILGEDEWNAVAYYLNRPENQDIKERTFFALHNYGINHPPDYPYNEGLTIFDDDVSILSFLAYAKWQQDTIGMVLPMIGGEGGWGFTNQDDPRYPRIMEELHAQYHGEMFDWFRTGVIGNGEPLPDYLLSIAPWILYCYLWPMDQWYYPQGGEHLPDTINAVKSIPPFIRQFSWDQPM